MIRALVGEGRSAKLLWRQVAESKRLQRSRKGRGYRLVVPETTEDLLIDLDDDVITRWQAVSDPSSAKRLEFRLRLRRGGFLEALEGRCTDGEWPGRWEVAPDELERLVPISMPRSRSCDSVLHWLGERANSVLSSELHCRVPADPLEVRKVEKREGAPLPTDFVELLERSDGLTVRDVDVHGSRDLFVTELNDAPWWVIASRRGEMFVVRHRDEPTGAYFRVDEGEFDPAEGVTLGLDAGELLTRLAQA